MSPHSQLSTTDSEPICLTDSPRVVELKREFEFLDQREQDLKPFRHHAHARTELEKVRARKSAIAAEVFKA